MFVLFVKPLKMESLWIRDTGTKDWKYFIYRVNNVINSNERGKLYDTYFFKVELSVTAIKHFNFYVFVTLIQNLWPFTSFRRFALVKIY
jgi:hypothetical protein